jgi:hypothetical protein
MYCERSELISGQALLLVYSAQGDVLISPVRVAGDALL